MWHLIPKYTVYEALPLSCEMATHTHTYPHAHTTIMDYKHQKTNIHNDQYLAHHLFK